eukprot:5528049-Pleurochrysis_carterae.AAC.1
MHRRTRACSCAQHAPPALPNSSLLLHPVLLATYHGASNELGGNVDINLMPFCCSPAFPLSFCACFGHTLNLRDHVHPAGPSFRLPATLRPMARLAVLRAGPGQGALGHVALAALCLHLDAAHLPARVTGDSLAFALRQESL